MLLAARKAHFGCRVVTSTLHKDRHSMKMIELPTTGDRDGDSPPSHVDGRQQPASMGPLNILWGREK